MINALKNSERFLTYRNKPYRKPDTGERQTKHKLATQHRKLKRRTTRTPQNPDVNTGAREG